MLDMGGGHGRPQERGPILPQAGPTACRLNGGGRRAVSARRAVFAGGAGGSDPAPERQGRPAPATSAGLFALGERILGKRASQEGRPKGAPGCGFRLGWMRRWRLGTIGPIGKAAFGLHVPILPQPFMAPVWRNGCGACNR